MLSAVVPFIVVVAIHADPGSGAIYSNHFFYVSRFIAALLVGTFVPFLIDRHARRSGPGRQ